MAEIDSLLQRMVEMEASDLHIKAGGRPVVRLHGRLIPLDGTQPLTPEQAMTLATCMMEPRELAAFEGGVEVDFAYSLDGQGRFRVNAFYQRGTAALALRRVGENKATVEQLGLPSVLNQLAEEPRGLILVTGTAGSGKTTTLAAMIDHINRTRDAHIITVEDPIEVVHEDIKGVVNQREVGIDTVSYAEALRHVVREDPDVILIGEMRDFDTVSAALTAAEIGNLVLSTLHTIDARETINRIIDFYEPHQQKQVRLMLASTLKGIVSMRLIPSLQGGLVPAAEVLVMTGTIREYIADEDKTYLIRDAMEEGQYYGMQTFDQSLLKLYGDGRISYEDAVSYSANAHDFKIKVRSLGIDPSAAAQGTGF